LKFKRTLLSKILGKEPPSKLETRTTSSASPDASTAINGLASPVATTTTKKPSIVSEMRKNDKNELENALGSEKKKLDTTVALPTGKEEKSDKNVSVTPKSASVTASGETTGVGEAQKTTKDKNVAMYNDKNDRGGCEKRSATAGKGESGSSGGKEEEERRKKPRLEEKAAESKKDKDKDDKNGQEEG